MPDKKKPWNKRVGGDGRKRTGQYRGLAAPWKPGQSGNPAGNSAKRRRNTALKDALQSMLTSIVDADWKGKLAELELDGTLESEMPDGTTFADAVGLRVLVAALRGDQKAIDQIISMEPKSIETDLTIADDTTEDDAASQLASIAKRNRKKSNSK